MFKFRFLFSDKRTMTLNSDIRLPGAGAWMPDLRIVITKRSILTGFGFLIRFACLGAFVFQTTTLVIGMIEPKNTLIETEKNNFLSIDFPIFFKVCIKPGFNMTELENLGYLSPLGYLMGESKYNSSVYGWAGHTSDGGIVSNVSGIE